MYSTLIGFHMCSNVSHCQILSLFPGGTCWLVGLWATPGGVSILDAKSINLVGGWDKS